MLGKRTLPETRCPCCPKYCLSSLLPTLPLPPQAQPSLPLKSLLPPSPHSSSAQQGTLHLLPWCPHAGLIQSVRVELQWHQCREPARTCSQRRSWLFRLPVPSLPSPPASIPTIHSGIPRLNSWLLAMPALGLCPLLSSGSWPWLLTAPTLAPDSSLKGKSLWEEDLKGV